MVIRIILGSATKPTTSIVSCYSIYERMFDLTENKRTPKTDNTSPTTFLVVLIEKET